MINPFTDTDNAITHVQTAVLQLNRQHAITAVNPAAQQLLGLSQRQLLGADFSTLLEHISLDKKRFEQAFCSGQSFVDSEVTLVVAGEPCWVELCATPLNHPEPSLLLELRPIDRRKQIGQELQLHAQQQAAKELVRGLAHEIKNPLGGLRGAAQLLAQELGTSELTDYTQLIIEQADRLRTLVDRLLGPQRLGQFEAHNVHSVLEKVHQLVALELPEHVAIVRDYDPSLPECALEPDLLQQALLNLVRNALEALGAQRGQITLKTRSARALTIHGQLHRQVAEIKVIDNGPGIPSAIRDTLFYPMVTGRVGGTGLGLSIAQNLISQHKGRIDCVSWPGHTEFTLYLPLSA
ncbi:MAG: nitrogen regulation protein NR(II) [Aeromonas sp.]